MRIEVRKEIWMRGRKGEKMICKVLIMKHEEGFVGSLDDF